MLEEGAVILRLKREAYPDFSQYLHIASTRKNPSERARLMQRANSLYETKQGILKSEDQKRDGN